MPAKKPSTTAKQGANVKKESNAPSQAIQAKDQVKHHPKSQYAGAAPPRNIQQPRISTTIPPNRQSAFPDANSAGLHGQFNSPHLSSAGGQGHQQSPYGNPQDPNYYPNPSPHSTASASGHYPTAGSDQMAATAHMSRPYPPIYHTPQSNSPASVASPQAHEQHGRGMYGAPPQLQQPMYGYAPYSPMAQVHPSQYATHSGPPPHHMAHPPIMQHPSSNAQMAQQQSMGQPSSITSSSPRLRVDPMGQQQSPQQMQQPQQQQAQQQQPTPQQATPRMMQQHTPTQASAMSASSASMGQAQTPTINPSAAPGPIPATTPLVVRQDGNGVQWIAFEYSRDRVKSEYTIRCDVESINVDTLSSEFKNENCVYPRACCGKENYKGNRLNYESECNTVGWALAELNSCLRGKRGLIQRAVDSWRNSNQDPRLRSRRVRRQAKVQHRNKTQQQAAQLSGPSPTSQLPGSSASIGPTGIRAPTTAGMNMGSAQLQHHHHGSGQQQDSSVEVDYASAPNSASASRQQPGGHSHPISSPTDLRQGQAVFAGYSAAYPPGSTPSSIMATGGYSSLDAVGRSAGVAAAMVSPPSSAVAEAASATTMHFPSTPKTLKSEDGGEPQQGNRLHLGMRFNQEGNNTIPSDAYRNYSEVPRATFPPQMPASATQSRVNRGGLNEEGACSTSMRSFVPSTTLEGRSEMPSFSQPGGIVHVERSWRGDLSDMRSDRQVPRGRGDQSPGIWSVNPTISTTLHV